MTTVKADYKGALRTQAKHLRSNKTLITDAPVDNHGKGESYSPTDLVATALLTCMMTVIGIRAAKSDWNVEAMTGEVLKHMITDPRRIGELSVIIKLPKALDKGERKILEQVAVTCPVANSLSQDLTQTVTFTYG